MRLLIMGAPGAGKGSQAGFMSDRLGIPAISTGDLFRHHVRERTPLGMQVEEIMRSGDYVPDSITNEIVRDRLDREDARDGFILDGYPRTPDQVGELDTMLAIPQTSIDAVIHLVVPDDALIPRLMARGAAEGRADDTADSIRHRLSVFESVTAPILAVYRRRNLLMEVHGLGTVREVSDRILRELADA